MRTLLYKISSDDSPIEKEIVDFFYTRLFYKSDEEIIRVYNKEYDIFCDSIKVQFILFITLDKIFRKRFNFSPIILELDNDKLELIGKVRFIKPDKIQIVNDLLRKV